MRMVKNYKPSGNVGDTNIQYHFDGSNAANRRLSTRSIEPGEPVLVHNEGPRTSWKLGVVERLHRVVNFEEDDYSIVTKFFVTNCLDCTCRIFPYSKCHLPGPWDIGFVLIVSRC